VSTGTDLVKRENGINREGENVKRTVGGPRRSSPLVQARDYSSDSIGYTAILCKVRAALKRGERGWKTIARKTHSKSGVPDFFWGWGRGMLRYLVGVSWRTSPTVVALKTKISPGEGDRWKLRASRGGGGGGGAEGGGGGGWLKRFPPTRSLL